MSFDPVAALDQATRGMRDLARIVRTYYDSLRAEGFDERDALELTTAYQDKLVADLANSAGDVEEL